MKHRDIVKLIEQDGWYWKRTNGSHSIYKHPTKTWDRGRCLSRLKDVPEGTVKSILRQASLEQ